MWTEHMKCRRAPSRQCVRVLYLLVCRNIEMDSGVGTWIRHVPRHNHIVIDEMIASCVDLLSSTIDSDDDVEV